MAISPDTATAPKVSQLATAIRRALGELGSGWVEGEVQDLHRSQSGHVYFRLADEDATIDCCIWRSRAARLDVLPNDGTLVQAHYEQVDFYGKAGRTSLHIDQLKLTGDGELLRRKQQALRRLQAEGLTDPAHRRPLPSFPRRVGVIAAKDSDAQSDVIESLRERFPAVHIVVRSALVEGVRAVDSIIDALIHLQAQDGVDVIVLARGGGGVRELVAFDDVKLCKAIFACDKPVVTSIGHTKQRPNCDHVAASYADVPARAAELVVPSAAELRAELAGDRAALDAVHAGLSDRAGGVRALWSPVCPREALEGRGLRLAGDGARLATAAHQFYGEREQTLSSARHRLARVRHDVPGTEELELPAERLRAAGERFFRARRQDLDGVEQSLAGARARVPTPSGVAAGALPLKAVGRRARRQYRDFAEAVDRRGREARTAVERRLGAESAATAEAGAKLSVAAARRMQRAARELDHIVELVEAKDFRPRGWVLAGYATGRPVRSVRDLGAGEELDLRFHDGIAEAVVTTIRSEGETS